MFQRASHALAYVVRTTTVVAAAKTGAFLMSLGRAEAGLLEEDGAGVPRLAIMLDVEARTAKADMGCAASLYAHAKK